MIDRLARDKALQLLSGQSFAAKNELLFQYGVNFNELPNWQKRGVGLYWETYMKEAVNKKTGEAVTAQRRRIVRNLDLPMRDEYDRFIRNILAQALEV